MDAKDPVARRLLEAWRGEVEAGVTYAALAEVQRDPRRAEIIRKLAATEAGHRRRLEQRMSELGIPIPDPNSVRLSPWAKLQLRLAPTERVLAAREAAEDAEVQEGYGRPTGDRQTDALFAEIRADERAHRGQMRTMRDAGAPQTLGVAGPQARLNRILGREKWHRSGSGWLSGAIYGANDGLAAVFGIVTGVSGATGAAGNFVLTAGLAGAIASALSMATGAFLAERSEAEVAAANVARERQEIQEHPEEEKEELSLFYQLKGISAADADALAAKLAGNSEAMLQLLANEEFGGAKEEGGGAATAALAAGLSTGIGAMIPVLPFFWLHGVIGVAVAAAVSLVAHFLVGAAKSLFTLRRWWAAGLEMTLAGIIVGGCTYLAGLAFHGG